MVLLIDNYDSFTFNLAQYLGELGAAVQVRRNDETSVPEIERLAPERIVISPGPGRPEDAGICVEVMVFRLGFADTRNEARQLVRHGHFRVNGRKVNIPSYLARPGDKVELKDRSKKVVRITEALEAVDRRGVPAWLELDKGGVKGTVKTSPSREDITMPIQEQLSVELYSK